MSDDRARAGWESGFSEFAKAAPDEIGGRLKDFIADASVEQVRAWKDSIPRLQSEVEEVLFRSQLAERYSAILEYELPMESRRPDAILLLGGGLLVVELKGKLEPSQADLDQAAAYARDLECYHRDCEDRPVVPVLVPTRAQGHMSSVGRVRVCGPDVLDELIAEITDIDLPAIARDDFLDPSAYRPLPTLVRAARELLLNGELRRINRAHAATAPAVDEIKAIVHEAARTRSRHLVLVTGVPGAGKTLVGLQTVHAHYLDDLAIDRADGKPTAPAVFLSGNGPLVEVLQYELKSAGGGGKTFVRDVKNYVRTYSASSHRVPPEHVLVYDEAQRAFDAAKVEATHKKKHGATTVASKSEPQLFVEFANRVPDWCVVVGLIGTGQEIHVGEEAGIVQWRQAVDNNPRWREWQVHVPPGVESDFAGMGLPARSVAALNLDVELRQHSARNLHGFVARLLAADHSQELRQLARSIENDGFNFRITRKLSTAKSYLRERYSENPDARFGILASSKDKILGQFEIENDFQATKRVRMGPWYGDAQDSPASCRQLTTCVTEFGAQGLELDGTLLAWGSDFVLKDGRWSNDLARGYKKGAPVRDPMQLRKNAYRVLLTRARDVTVFFVPDTAVLDETHAYLLECGTTPL